MSIHFIDPFAFKKYLFPQKVYQAPSLIIDTILDFMVLSHFNGVRAIITSLYVVGLSLFKINPLSTNQLFDHKVNHTYKVQ